MVLNIPYIETSKSKDGSPFYTIRPILKRNWDTSKISNKTIKQRDKNKYYKILNYSVFENLDTLFDFYDYKLFNVGKTKEDVIKYYRKLYGKQLISKKRFFVVFRLRIL